MSCNSGCDKHTGHQVIGQVIGSGIKAQIKENTVMIGSLAKALEFNAAELKECKSKVVKLEERMTLLEKENADLKGRTAEHERYSRRWNLRIKVMKEVTNENTKSVKNDETNNKSNSNN